MSAGIQLDKGSHSPDLPPIASEDLAKLGVESQLIPLIISAASRAERSSHGTPSPPLGPGEVENLIEILNKVYLTL